MNYRNTQIKLDELIGYFRNEKINLIPPFQRGRVWTTSLRKRLLENMIRGNPIPAIFLYKEESGSMYSYNILDGKQRLESILLFVADARPDFSVPNWRNYFFKADPAVKFAINISKAGERTKNKTFAELDDALVRDFREYSIPVIEIDLDMEEGGLQEIIDLFIDINQLGVKVNRFDIVRTMYEKNRLLSDVFKFRAPDMPFGPRRNDGVRLSLLSGAKDPKRGLQELKRRRKHLTFTPKYAEYITGRIMASQVIHGTSIPHALPSQSRGHGQRAPCRGSAGRTGHLL